MIRIGGIIREAVWDISEHSSDLGHRFILQHTVIGNLKPSYRLELGLSLSISSYIKD